MLGSISRSASCSLLVGTLVAALTLAPAAQALNPPAPGNGRGVPHNRIFSFSSRMSQQLRRRTFEAVFSLESVEIQFALGLFPRRKRLAAVLGDAGLDASTTQSVNLTPFRRDLTTDGTDEAARSATNFHP